MLTLVRLLGGVLLILSNAFFVATEFALTRLRQFEPAEFEDDHRLARAWEMTEELEIYLTGCQVGITFSSILLGIVAEPALTRLLTLLFEPIEIGTATSHGIAAIIGILLINLAHTVWAEQTPTYLGIERAKQVARYFATPHYYWTKLMSPFITLGDGVSKWTLGLMGIEMERSWTEETESSPGTLRQQMADLLDDSNIPADRSEEVLKALEIGEISTQDIMVPRDEVEPLSTRDSFTENMNRIRQNMRNRYPLIGDSLEDFKGVLYASEILGHVEALQSGELVLDDLDRTDMTVPAEMPVSELIDEFQRQNQELALVRNDAGTVIGLVTLTDALEVIVGDVDDPLDVEHT